MGNCVGSKGVKKDPKILTEEEIKVLLDNTNLTRAQIVALHQNFLKECPSGKLTKKDFVKLFKEVHPSENKNEKADKFCEYVFKVIDTNNLGYISFQDFVVCFSLTSYGDFNKKCEFAFKLYDLDRDGIISKKEMTQVLTALYDLSGITDRKGENAPAKKVDEIIKKINLKSADPEVAAAAAAALAAEAKKKEKPEKKPKEPKQKKTKEQIKEEKERQKAEKEAAKREKEQKAKEAKEKKAREAEEKKKRAAENKSKGIKEPKEPKPAKPAKAKLNEYITKEQFIEACNTDETLKKLFVDSIFSQQADQSMLEAKIDDIGNKLNVELPSVSVKSGDGKKSTSTTKTIQVSAPKVSVNNGPVDETKFVSTTTTRVTPADKNDQPVTVTTTTRVHPDGTVTTTEETTPAHHASPPSSPAAGGGSGDQAHSDSDQTHYSEHTEYVNVNESNNSKHINIELSTDGLKINQSDRDQQQQHQ